MQKSKKIIELEKELAKEKAEEAKLLGFDLVIFDDSDELTEIKVKPRELIPQDQAEVLSKSEELHSNMDEIQVLTEKIESGESTYIDSFNLLFIIEEPLKTILSLFFDVEKEKVATLPNIDLLLTIIQGSEFTQLQNKTSKVSKEVQYVYKNK